MGKSFILKDRSGTVVGYFQQGIHTARCRLSGAEEGMEIILFYAGGKQKSRRIEAAGKEMEWEEAGGVIDGVAIVRNGLLAAASSPQVRFRFEQMHSTAQTNEKKNDPVGTTDGKPHESLESEEENKSKKKKPAEKNMMPERRWPRPPCWQEAVYRHGMWMDRQ